MSFKRSDGSDALRIYALSNGREGRLSRDSVLTTLDDNASIAESVVAPLPEPKLPDLDLPQSSLDLTMTFDTILSSANTSPEPETDKVQKRASNVLKLAQENAKLQEELKAMNARLEAAEKKQAELRRLEAQAGQAANRAAATS
ncbi:hypothetical protein BDY19DRAFT_902619 [Irpex rosettiformis]|uniref:Uncharacterized protein n=1 Tax=Irpex rosettiformis TaxID=378272 RepID=A0ACB8UHZ6_9APHY|nr:hypothetical protein BDY19DRAFT_902619 [Irpex rosettiformis]